MRVESPVETILGFLVISIAIGFAVFASQGTGATSVSGAYPLVASFSSAAGVAPGTDVRIAGVKVGTVSDVSLDGDTYRATTTMMIRDGVEVPEDSIAVIDSEGLLGGTYVGLSPGGSFDVLGPGDEIENTQGSISLNDIIARALGAIGASSSQ